MSARRTLLRRYRLLLFSAIDPPPPSEIALTVAGIDFSASISAQAGQFSYERPSVSLTCLRMRAFWRSAFGLVDLGELGLRLVDRGLHALGQADRRDDDLDALEVLAAEVAREVGVERLADRLLDLDEVRVGLGAGLWSSAPPRLESSAHEETSCSQRKRPSVSRRALSSTGRNSVSRNAPKPSSPSHGCRRPAWPGTG